MSDRSFLVATAEQKVAFQALSRSDVRGEADWARAILLTLQGLARPHVAEAFGVTADAVRHWRRWFSESGVDALSSTLAPSPSPEQGKRALDVVSLLLRQLIEDRINWTLPRLRAEIERQTGAGLSPSRLSVLLKRGASIGTGHREAIPWRDNPRSGLEGIP